MLPQPVGLLRLMLNLICTIYIQRRELYIRDFIKHTLHWPGSDLLQTWYDARHNNSQHKVVQTSAMFDHVRDIIAKRTCEYCDCRSFER